MKLQAIQWNPPARDGRAVFAADCQDHPAVRPTSYMEVWELIRTSGCSKEEPYWVWSVMGVLETPKGRLVVSPGDWIIELPGTQYAVIPNTVYEQYPEAYKDIA